MTQSGKINLFPHLQFRAAPDGSIDRHEYIHAFADGNPLRTQACVESAAQFIGKRSIGLTHALVLSPWGASLMGENDPKAWHVSLL